jgi:hypothetical protein
VGGLACQTGQDGLLESLDRQADVQIQKGFPDYLIGFEAP